MLQSVRDFCPYCGAPIRLVIDPLGDLEYIEDCEVCCRPINIQVVPDSIYDDSDSAEAEVILKTENEV